jgi:hypothetical protein
MGGLDMPSPCTFDFLRAEFVIPGDKAITEHAVEATADWKKYTLLGCGFVGAVGVLEFFVHLSHGHHEVAPSTTLVSLRE